MSRHRFAAVAAITQLRAVGEAAIYAPKDGGAPIQTQAIIREATEVLSDGEVPVATYTPTARIARAAVAKPAEGDRIIVGARVWRVREVQDHQGAMWLLLLNEARAGGEG